MDMLNEVDSFLDKSDGEKILTIEGMMCEHCEKTVKNALERINGVNKIRMRQMPLCKNERRINYE